MIWMVEPDAWMAYNNMGGAGLVPYLLKSRAEDNTNLMSGDGPPAWETNEFPQPLYSESKILGLIEQLHNQDLSMQSYRFEIGYKKALTDLREEVSD